jgi:hypothetical protein
VLPQGSAAGDISPHLLWHQRAEQIMLQRKKVTRRQEIALRIADGVDRVFPVAKVDVQTALVVPAHGGARELAAAGSAAETVLQDRSGRAH